MLDMINIDDLKFDENGLIPAIIVDAGTGAVLMLAYMNAESLRISIEEGMTCFWSRKRKELWRKGYTSGNVQHIVSIKADCDRDALTVTVIKDGPACHTGAESCFFEEVFGRKIEPFTLDTLFSIITDRKENRKPGSYTTYLFEKGIDKILKKVGEESTEVIIAGKAGDTAETIYEIADLTYHAMVLMAEMGIKPSDIKKELASRYVADSEDSEEK
jgi:phosphoribosyl-ATP pyrophosphohydrolase/phosphoribosyl-AMP cyclohydrolase